MFPVLNKLYSTSETGGIMDISEVFSSLQKKRFTQHIALVIRRPDSLSSTTSILSLSALIFDLV